MKETFITGLDENNKNNNNDNKKYKRSCCLFEVNKDLKQKKSEYGKVKEGLLEFLIEEKANFADFDKIYEHYLKELKSNYRKYNENKLKIQKMQTEYNGIMLSIESKIVNNLSLTKTDLSFYDYIINNLKKTIRLKEHELECYNNMHSRLYKTNYMINKTYKNQLIIQQLTDEQHDKFSVLQNQAISMFKNQNNALKEIIRYREIINEEFEKNKKNKIHRINKLELEIYDIKKDNLHLERYINKIKEKQGNIKREIKFQRIINKKTKNEIKSIMKEYYSLIGKLLYIYSAFKIKDINNVRGFIKKLNENENNNHQLNIKFKEDNKIITEMQNLLTNLELKKNNIQEKIEKSKIVKNDLIEYNEIINSIKRIKGENKIILQKFIKQKDNFISYLNYLVNYSNKISPYLKKLSFDESSMYKLSIDYLVDKFPKFLKINNTDYSYSIDLDFLKQKLNKKNIKTVLQFFISTFKIFNYNLLSIINFECNSISLKLLKKSVKSKTIKFQNEEFKKIYNKKVEKSFNNEEARKLYLKKAEREVLQKIEGKEKTKLSKEEKKLSKKKYEISGEDLYLTYLNYMNNKKKYFKSSRNNTFHTETKNSNNNQNAYIKSHPRRSIAILGDFSNNLVLSPSFSSSTFLRKSLINNSNNTTTNFFKQNKKEILSQKKNSFAIKSINRNEELDESDIKTQDNYNNEEKKQIVKKKKINKLFNTKDPEMSNIYVRANELRRLELHLFKKKEKDILEIINFNKFYKLIEKYKKKLPFLKNVKSESNLQNSNYSNKLTRVYYSDRNLDSYERNSSNFSTSVNKSKFNSRNSVEKVFKPRNSETSSFRKKEVKKSKSTVFMIQLNPKGKSVYFS